MFFTREILSKSNNIVLAVKGEAGSFLRYAMDDSLVGSAKCLKHATEIALQPQNGTVYPVKNAEQSMVS